MRPDLPQSLSHSAGVPFCCPLPWPISTDTGWLQAEFSPVTLGAPLLLSSLTPQSLHGQRQLLEVHSKSAVPSSCGRQGKVK